MESFIKYFVFFLFVHIRVCECVSVCSGVSDYTVYVSALQSVCACVWWFACIVCVSLQSVSVCLVVCLTELCVCAICLWVSVFNLLGFIQVPGGVSSQYFFEYIFISFLSSLGVLLVSLKLSLKNVYLVLSSILHCLSDIQQRHFMC